MSWSDDEEEDFSLIDLMEQEALSRRQGLGQACGSTSGSGADAGAASCSTAPLALRQSNTLGEVACYLPVPTRAGAQHASHLARAGSSSEQRVAGPTASSASTATRCTCGVAQLLTAQPELPWELVELRLRADRFRNQARSMPPPPPTHPRCPGVFNRGCGGELRWIVAGPPDADGQPTVAFWRCQSADCHYREYPPRRLTVPQLSIQVVWPDAVEVVPMPGAEEVTSACGGVGTVLAVAGVDMRRAIISGAVASAPPGSRPGTSDRLPSLDAGAGCGVPAAPPAQASCSPSSRECSQVRQANLLALQPTRRGGPAHLDSNDLREQQDHQLASPHRQQEPVDMPPTQPVEQVQELESELLPGPAHMTPRQQQQMPPPPPPTPPPRVTFRLGDYEYVRSQLQQCGKMVGLPLLPQAGLIPVPTLLAARGTLHHRTPVDEVEQRYECMPPWLERALLPFQREGVLFGLEHGGRLLLADEMGVGKTVQALALASCYCDEWPMLVVAPASVRLMWAEEIERWLPHLRPSQLHVIEGSAGRVSATARPLATIISYEMLQRLTCEACKGRTQRPPVKGGPAAPTQRAAATCMDPVNCMAGMGWRVMIVDESHVMRTSNHVPDAQHTEAVLATVKLAARAIFLTGMPSLSRPFDLFNQVHALCPGLLGPDRVTFATNYCARRLVPAIHAAGSQAGGLTGMRWNNSGLTRAGELHGLLRNTVMLRRLKRDVLSQLPPKRRQVVRLPKPSTSDWPSHGAPKGKGSKAKPANTGAPAAEDEEEEEEEEEEGQEGSMSAMHRTGLAKLPSVVDWLMHALGGIKDQSAKQDEGVPVGGDLADPKHLVFAHHRDVMAGLAAALEGTTGYPRVGYVKIDGMTDAADRQQAVATFRENPGVRVALLSVTAAGVGLDFSAASSVVFAELPEEVALVRQAEDRAHRRGQRMPVNVYFLCAKGTTDDRLWQALNRSLARVSAVHDGTGVGGGALAGKAPGECNVPQASQAGLVVARVCDLEQQGPEAAWRLTLSPGAAAASPWAAPAAPRPVDVARTSSPGVASALAAPSVGRREGGQAGRGAGTGTDQRRAGDVKQGLASEPMPDTAAAMDVDQDQQGLRTTIYFEVSPHTGRVHLHSAADGSQPVRLSLPAEALLVDDSPTLQEVLAALAAACQPQGLPPSDSISVVVASAGLVALPSSTTVASLAAWLADAREFAAEWRELRGVHQSRLAGQVLRPPLDAAVEAVEEAAAAAGALGQSTDRFVDGARHDLVLPPGSTWRPVCVRFPRWNKEATYQQPFASIEQGGHRLCLNCGERVPGAEALPAETVLPGSIHLFCSGPCEQRFGLKSNSAAYRRALFALERGRCVLCGLDCHALVKRLQTVERGTLRWAERRRLLVAHEAPRFLKRGYAAQLEQLVKRAVEGNAWHADHIQPVYQGGGLCDVDNLRTLCVLCHKDVTMQQAKERAKERAAERKAAAAAEEEGQGWVQEADAGQDRLRRRPPRLKRVFSEDSD